MKRYLKLIVIVVLAGAAALGLASCGGDGDNSITVYSGRSDDLIQPILDRFEEQTGINVNVKYDDSATLALLIQSEGSQTPADVFISQSPGAVGFLAANDLLAQIPSQILNLVDAAHRADDGTWVGLTGRQRVLVYNPERVTQNELPSSIDDLVRPEYRGRVAVAPQNSSFQDFITAMRFERGDEATAQWLHDMGENNSPNYPKNSAIVQAVIAGEVDMGLVNHYYLLRELAENPDASGINHYFPSNDVGSLLIVTGGAILEQSENKDEAAQLLEFLLSRAEQRYFVSELREYPLAAGAGVSGPEGVPNLNAFRSPSVTNLNQLGNLTDTVNLIGRSGIVTS